MTEIIFESLVQPQLEPDLRKLLEGEKYRTAKEGYGIPAIYPTIELSAEDDGLLLKASRRGCNRFDLGEKVFRTLVSNQGLEETWKRRGIPTITKVAQRINNATQYDIRTFYNDLPSGVEVGKEALVVIVPLLSTLSCTEPLMKGLILLTSDNLCVVDVCDGDQVKFCVDYVLQNTAVLKFSLNAAVDVPLLCTFMGCAPVSVLCLSALALKVLKHYDIPISTAPVTVKNSKMLLNWERHFGVDWNELIVNGPKGFYDPNLQRYVWQYVKVLGIVLASISALNNVSEINWVIEGKWDPMGIVAALHSFLPKEVGMNFWTSMVLALRGNLDVTMFVYAFAYESFIAMPKLTKSRCPQYEDVRPTYDRLRNAVRGDSTRREGCLVDMPFMDEVYFANLLANMLNGFVVVPWSTQVGTLGEVNRRLKVFINFP